jgi:P27 family predicted phage terminase small subunit
LPRQEAKAPAGATAPGELQGDALAEFNRVTPLLEKLGLLTQIDRSALVGYCQAWEDLLWAIRTLRKDGRVATAGNGTLIAHPAANIQKSAMAAMLKFSAEFGMTPAARANLDIVAGGDESDQEKRFFGGEKAKGPA